MEEGRGVGAVRESALGCMFMHAPPFHFVHAVAVVRMSFIYHYRTVTPVYSRSFKTYILQEMNDVRSNHFSNRSTTTRKGSRYTSGSLW